MEQLNLFEQLESPDENHGYYVKILADSVTREHSYKTARLTSFEVRFPRFILAEFNTHRLLSRNSASSRAIPIEKRIEEIQRQPYIPMDIGANKKGMQAGEALDEKSQDEAQQLWLDAMESAIYSARHLAELGVHKQWANRLLEPFAWNTAVVTGTEWENFFNLRTHEAAQPEFRIIATMMREAMTKSTPKTLFLGDYHLPFFDPILDKDLDQSTLIKVCVARCARVSYMTHDGKRDVQADLDLYDRLVRYGHMSPLEHVAYIGDMGDFIRRPKLHSNFAEPFIQYRKTIVGESVFRAR